jgi:LSD1 subclass zinc finger protein
MLCKSCERIVAIIPRGATLAECSICHEVVFDAAAEAADMEVDADQGVFSNSNQAPYKAACCIMRHE